MRLNELRDNPGARKNRKRVGRGPGSGKGKTSGAGHKGQNSRSGVALGGFEGGQMPLYRRLPKRGFSNAPFRKRYSVINLGILDRFVRRGKIDAGQTVTEAVLVDSGAVNKLRDGVRLLGKGDLTVKLDIEVTGASKAAVTAVEKLAGTVTLTAPAKDAGETPKGTE